MPTNFLESAGTNGFLATPFNLLSTELNALATATSTASSVGGAGGVFTQTNYANAIWAEVYFQSGGAFTPAAPNYLAGWFLFSPDGGTTFEATVSNTDLPRAPDFIIPLFVSAYATNSVSQASGLVRVPFWSNKVFINSHAGATLPATGNVIKAAPVAIQY
jgi:hypothetical protein